MHVVVRMIKACSLCCGAVQQGCITQAAGWAGINMVAWGRWPRLKIKLRITLGSKRPSLSFLHFHVLSDRKVLCGLCWWRTRCLTSGQPTEPTFSGQCIQFLRPFSELLFWTVEKPRFPSRLNCQQRWFSVFTSGTSRHLTSSCVCTLVLSQLLFQRF